ncbi:unnamed protein product [Mycetohabitans rhizoxinica HKI 454]|uniref:Uncharacterized protein n=1 Tax=Mycetohabitans rhizoxinica (strain DSM 19002 / CIP 109453 / HKI 454) TaxID=882378 RepID=E5AMM1_MYCRK|nr:unnamed protein product [Mycetohabitans rhizoxinica HKI 454]
MRSQFNRPVIDGYRESKTFKAIIPFRPHGGHANARLAHRTAARQ